MQAPARDVRTEGAPGGVALAASLVPALAGLVASAMLLVDYVRPAPVFCAEGSGCEALRRTAFAAPLGVPLPVVGVLGFLAMGVVSLVPGKAARVAQAALSAGAGAVGVVLAAVQVRLGHYCPYCGVADASGVAAALVGGWRLARGGWDWAAPAAAVVAAAGALVAAVVVPLAVGLRMAAASPQVPAVIRAEIARTPPGEATIVDFVDFECPFCRMTHAELAPLLEAHRSRIRLVRKQVPLRIHPHALDAARAACCGERLGKGDAMADALFAAPVQDLTAQGCERIAEAVGLALGPYRACVADPATDARIEADRAEFREAGGYALPTIWIDETELVGAQPPEALAKALDEALARAGG